MKVPEWHIITSEYPPQPGGVSDYTWQVAKGLAAAGDRVHVWGPSWTAAEPTIPGVTLQRTMGTIHAQGLRRLSACLDAFPAPRRLLVQWVPHGYGYHSMNLPFCVWLWNRARKSHDEVDLMVHEPFLAFGEGSWKQDLAASVHRIMTMIILNAASRIWVSIPAWEECLRPYLLGRKVPIRWLPIPSNIECTSARESDECNQVTVGHFGTFGRSICEMLEPLIPPLLDGHSNRCLVLMGRESTKLYTTIIEQYPALARQVHATGEVTAPELSSWLVRCNIMIQPYPDGISSRRGTAMAALAHGVPMVTTIGKLTEKLWAESGAVALAPTGDVYRFSSLTNEILADRQKRIEMSGRALQFYSDHFHLQHTIRALRTQHERPAHGTCN